MMGDASKQAESKQYIEVTMATQTQPTTQAPVILRSSVESLHTYHPHTYQQGGRAGSENPASYAGDV